MSDFLSRARAIVGDAYVLTDAGETLPYFKEYRGRYTGEGLAVIRPANTQEISQIVKLCAEQGVAIVPQGGNTSLVGGSIPYDRKAVVLSTSRLNKIRAIDADNFTATVDAGVVLATMQQAAADADRFFPLSYGAEGSAQIGGAIATNAGGILTIRYGNCRDLVLGLEVVLPDGEIWDGLRGLRKDNSGYDLKQMFIGAEGTLGIVTAAVVKLYPRAKSRETFFAAVETPEAALELLSRMRGIMGDMIVAYELISRDCVALALETGMKITDPVQTKTPWLVMAEIVGGENSNLNTRMEEFLGQMFEAGIILDATIAMNEQQRGEFWFLREAIVEAQRHAGGSIKHDVSVAVSDVPQFIAKADALVRKLIPGVRPMIFGHMGDGNLHFNLTRPIGADVAAYLARWDEVNHAVHDVVQEFNGSISAEHGVGVFKAAEIAARKSPVEMRLMRAVKNALDPLGIMNPGKVLPKQ